MEATDHLNKSNEIGSGGYGIVFIGNNLRCSGTTVAIKVLTKVCYAFKNYVQKNYVQNVSVHV